MNVNLKEMGMMNTTMQMLMGMEPFAIPVITRPFSFIFNKCDIRSGGTHYGITSANGEICGTFINNGGTNSLVRQQMQMVVKISCAKLDEYFAKTVVFDYVMNNTTNNVTRIVWCKDEDNALTPSQQTPTGLSLFFDDSESVYMAYLHHYTKEIHIELFKDVQPVMPENPLLSALKRTNSRTPAAGGKYADILAYFDRHPLGSEMPVLTLLSTLPPRDRCSILEVIREKDPSNVEVYNKLSMAYLKNGEESKAYALLQEGYETGELDHFTYEQLAEKIKFLSDNMRSAPQKPSQSYAESLSILQGRFAEDAKGEFGEFYGLLIALCRMNND
jgi:hypothetical protein